ncbi:MAG: TRAP transporter substrate-binding protein, partial [Roseibium sp.]
MRLFTRTAMAVIVTAATATAAWADAREVRIASHVSEFSPLHAQSKLFAEEIENRLPGQFVFKLYPSGQLGKEKDL